MLPPHPLFVTPHPAARTPELLAPAGGPDQFAVALAAGADAIYCGMGPFNARRKAESFDESSFGDACRMAHLAGARVYLTVNTVIRDDEMPAALALVSAAAGLGADAFIIQDWGLLGEVRRLMPELETHISTQANVHDARGAVWCAEHGAQRVTLSRELPLAEVSAIARTGIEVEVFAHGSICVCYSGLCQLSSFVCDGRSANRGMCARPCRLPLGLVDEEGRSLAGPDRPRGLCSRDLRALDLLPELCEIGVAALKLEGRMKAADYVFSVTEAYRLALDDLAAGTEPDSEGIRLLSRQLSRCFNRGFTDAYLRGSSGDEMMSYGRANNRGEAVGEVVGEADSRTAADDEATCKGAGRSKLARVLLHKPVGAGDLLELLDDAECAGMLTARVDEDADAGEIICCRIKGRARPSSEVRLIRSQEGHDRARAAAKRLVPRRRLVDATIDMLVGEPLSITLTCCDDPALRAGARGTVVESARTRPASRSDLIEHVGRTESSPFAIRSFVIQLGEGAGVAFSEIHRVRSAACEALELAILRAHRAAKPLPTLRNGRDRDSDFALLAHMARSSDREDLPGDVAAAAQICALVTSPAAARAARQAGAERIYLASDDLDRTGIGVARADDEQLVAWLDEICRESDRQRLDRWIYPNASVVVGNISELARVREVGARAEIGPTIPVHNVACARILRASGARGFWLSPELSLAEIERIALAAKVPVGVTVAGRPRVMTTEHCLLQVVGSCYRNCTSCKLRSQALYFRGDDGGLLPVRTDVHGRSRLFAAACVDLMPQLPQLIEAGVMRYLIDGTLMPPDEVARGVERAARALAAARAGSRQPAREAATTLGCLFSGVS